MDLFQPVNTLALRTRKRSRLPHLLISICVALLYSFGVLNGLEHKLMDLRFNSYAHTTTTDSVLVGIDSKSLRELNKWPWRRSLHADLLRKLTASGARRIVLDIDLSSSSTPLDDSDLAAAIRDADGKIVLPVFKQRIMRDKKSLSYTEPLAIFAQHAQTASVNIQAEADSLVRRYNRVEPWNGGLVPALATQLLGLLPDYFDPFYLDYSLRQETIPYLSYVDILNGQYNEGEIKGRTVFVGATAVELGDMLPVPVLGSLPGSLVQILAYESLKAGRAIERTSPLWSLISIFLLSVFLGPRISAWSWRRGFCVTLGAIGLVYAAATALQAAAPLSADISPLLLVLTLSYVWSLIQQIDIQSLGLFRQHMAAVHNRALMSSVVSESFDGIIITKSSGEIRFANPAACSLLGVDMDELTTNNISRFLQVDITEETESFENSMTGSQAQVLVKSAPVEVRTAGGSRIPAEYSVTVVPLVLGQSPFEVRTDNRSAYIYTLHDIREIQKVATLLREAHDQLEIKVKQRTIQLEQARDEAEAANRLKSQLLTTMSHELRTPLTSIIGSLRLVKEGVIGTVAGDARDLVGVAWKNSVQLAKLVNDIIDTERFEAQEQKLQLERLNLAVLVGDGIDLNNGFAKEYQVTIVADGIVADAYVLGDRDRLLQVLANLLSNAIKFSPVDGAVGVTLKRSELGFRVAVSNAGEAIPLEIRGTIFDKFVRGNNTDNRNVGGAGLGLAISQAIIVEHGGQIDFTTSDEKGTTFFFDLPKP
ncbi:MAG: CHASE2 domain-containing protein [Rhodospirillales bacterium]|nr:CHASE2 domain-containing protein [Rhodospirillales bacterium]